MIKSKRIIIKLISSSGSNHYYTTTKNKNNNKLSIKKYDPIIKKHIIYNEFKK